MAAWFSSNGSKPRLTSKEDNSTTSIASAVKSVLEASMLNNIIRIFFSPVEFSGLLVKNSECFDSPSKNNDIVVMGPVDNNAGSAIAKIVIAAPISAR